MNDLTAGLILGLLGFLVLGFLLLGSYFLGTRRSNSSPKPAEPENISTPKKRTILSQGTAAWGGIIQTRFPVSSRYRGKKDED